ncbi:MAG: hypothetical protein NDJ75_03365 [Thermoanaerobaculia bacterium]|nr:hypothetical protein [Thermoanaerobaculia bacterium]
MSPLLDAVAARCELLGIERLPLALLAADVVLLLALAGGVVARLERASGAGRWGTTRTLLASALALLAAVVLSATALGGAGWLGWRTLLASHVVLLAALQLAERSRGLPAGPRALAAWLRRPLAAAAAPLRELLSRAAWSRSRAAASIALLALVAVLAFYLVLALFTPPFNYDSNTYRLSRLALWLQEGSIHHFPTNDWRQNWIGQNTELVMLWLTGFFRRDYPLVKLAQWGGGALCCLAVAQLGAWLGLSRFWRLGAALTLLGIPTLATQFVSSQNDLFTAGCLAAGLAFLPSALRAGRWPDWALVGAGVGLAVGAKATVLYWAPGLLLLFAGWAWSERCAPRPLVRGAALAVAVALPLGGFNLLLNQIEYGSAVAPGSVLSHLGQVERRETAPPVPVNFVGFVWQLFEPHSNPYVPKAIHAAGFEGLLDWLAPRSAYYRRLDEEVSQPGNWTGRGLNEDEASFGLPVAAAALLGALAAFAGALARRRRERLRAALLGVAIVAFLLVYAWMSGIGVNQYRYFCLLGPPAALLAVDLFARRRAVAWRALGGLFVALQLATAVHVGVASRNQGLAVLRDPAAARWFAIWSASRELPALLGERPLTVGLALYSDNWQAPLLRSGVPHRWRLVHLRELRDRPGGVRELLDARGFDALVADPYMFRNFDLAGVGTLLSPHDAALRRAVYRPLAAGERVGPRIFLLHGVYPGRWSAPNSAFWLSDWSSRRFEIAVANPSPLARDVELRSRRAVTRSALAPGARERLAVEVGERDVVSMRVRPAFVPVEHGVGSDPRRLGLLLDPLNSLASEGLFGDRWTAPRATLRVAHWQQGEVVLDVENPTPFARTLRATSSLQAAEWALAPGARRAIALAVAPYDEVALEVTPAFVPRRDGGGADDRELGVLLHVGPWGLGRR